MYIVSLLATASAGPLHEVATIELDNVRELHRAVRTADTMARFEVSPECLEADAKAGEQILAARAKFDDKKTFEAYTDVHGILGKLQPCATELMAGPKSMQLTLKAMMRTSDTQLAALRKHVESKPNETAEKHMAAATSTQESARSKSLAGEIPEALVDWFKMTDVVYETVKSSI